MKSQRKVEPGCRRQFLASGTVIAAGALLETLGLTACSPLPTQKPVIGLVLGAGAARGFAHIGVIKSLEAQGIRPDLVIGSSAGSVVAALLASGLTGNEMNRLAMNLDEATTVASLRSLRIGARPASTVFGNSSSVPLTYL